MKLLQSYLSLFIIFVGFTAQMKAQPHTRTISGLVTAQEDGSPLEGVEISVKGGTAPSGTQADGMYYIPVSDKDSILIFSREEFQTREIRLTAATEYNIVLQRGQNTGSTNEQNTVLPNGQDVGLRNGQTPPQTKTPFSAIGNWRAVFQLRPDVEVPVTFDIRTTQGGTLKAFFHNAEERFEGGRVQTKADSLFIFLDQFDNELAFHIEDGGLTGVLRKQDGTGSPLPVTARTGVDYRFRDEGIKPTGDLSGTYDIIFRSEGGKEEKAVGIFRQEGNTLKATFLRITGDSRYLEGVVEGDQFYLSSFIGSGPSYYKGSFTSDGRLNGEIIGAHSGQGFVGLHNEKAALPDAYTLTGLKAGYSSFDFSFPDLNGHQVTLQDKKFRNKVVLVTIGGTWCPNCVDETAFLAPWYTANRQRGVEIVSIQYERQTDTAFVRKVLTRQREKYDITYDQVFGGLADKQGVARSLPSLNTFLAFPTTIFIDRKGKVAKIHTGYSGPATGIYYQQFVKEFNEEVDSLLRN